MKTLLALGLILFALIFVNLGIAIYNIVNHNWAFVPINLLVVVFLLMLNGRSISWALSCVKQRKIIDRFTF